MKTQNDEKIIKSILWQWHGYSIINLIAKVSCCPKNWTNNVSRILIRILITLWNEFLKKMWYSINNLNPHKQEKMLARILMVREVQEHMLADLPRKKHHLFSGHDICIFFWMMKKNINNNNLKKQNENTKRWKDNKVNFMTMTWMYLNFKVSCCPKMKKILTMMIWKAKTKNKSMKR